MATLQVSRFGCPNCIWVLLDCCCRSNHSHIRPLQFGPIHEAILRAPRCSAVDLDLLHPRFNWQLGGCSRRHENRELPSQLTKSGHSTQNPVKECNSNIATAVRSRPRFLWVFHELFNTLTSAFTVWQPLELPLGYAFPLLGNEIASIWFVYPFKLAN